MKKAFTLLELVFVIVIIGILGKFGVEFISRAYQSFIYTKINHSLQAESAMAVESIAARLQYRIKDSIIARDTSIAGLNNFDALGSIQAANATNYTILEWVGSDIDGFRGDVSPMWSSVMDVDRGNNLNMFSFMTDARLTNTLIQNLSDNNSDNDELALYFIGSTNDITTAYAWDGVTTTIDNGNGAMKNINSFTFVNSIPYYETAFTLNTAISEVSEYYSLAWSAYAVIFANGELTLHSDYQPWLGEDYTNANRKDLLMKNVETFQFVAIGSLVKIQVCVKSDIVDTQDNGGYALCKEKTIY